MPYTIHHIAKLARVTPRTLRYYDKMGLLAPAYIGKNGYRHYTEDEMVRLQQILFFRELEFSIGDIKRMMGRVDFDVIAALGDQKKLMQLKRDRITGLIKSLDKTIMCMKDNTKMREEEMYDAFKDDDVKQYQDEVKKRWGESEAYKHSMAKVSGMTKVEMAKLKESSKKLTQKLADAMDEGITSQEVQSLIAEHHEGINFFYDCKTNMYRMLGQMYVHDPRFTAHYNAFRPGLAQFMCDAIAVHCDRMEGKIS